MDLPQDSAPVPVPMENNPEPQNPGSPGNESGLNEDEEPEYGCRYCQKKFTNKQALGGHQNAHKMERALEKNVRDAEGQHFAYFGGAALPYPPIPNPFSSPFGDYVNRPFYPRLYPPPGFQYSYNRYPIFPFSGHPYQSNFHPGIVSFTPPHIMNQGFNDLSVGQASGSENERPDLSALMANDDNVEDADLDLSLKL